MAHYRRGGGRILKEGAFARSTSLSRLLLGTFLAETGKVPPPQACNVAKNTVLFFAPSEFAEPKSYRSPLPPGDRKGRPYANIFIFKLRFIRHSRFHQLGTWASVSFVIPPYKLYFRLRLQAAFIYMFGTLFL